jgi:3-deoxy-D-manno-octulosonic-acid transferase
MLYQFLTILLWPVLFVFTLKISMRDNSRRYLFQRLGWYYTSQNNQTIWTHCASVGEVNTYLPLHRKLLIQFPDTQFVITTNTVTGAQTVIRQQLERTTHCFLPVESTCAIKRFLKTCKPSQCQIMETEIWPLLYRICHFKKIPVKIINARLSHRTLNTNSWVKSLYKTSLSTVNKILCKSNEELINFKSLGATDKQLVIAGNLKFTSGNNTLVNDPIQLSGRHYCVAASTHNDEEQQLATLWNRLNTDLVLVIVPRHPNRSKQIQSQLNALNFQYAVRSKQQILNQNTKIYLADTLGELTQFMQGAEFVFIGGSLIRHGGQNILEPCRLAKPTICGPHMFNFKEELAYLLENKGCIQVNSLIELENTISSYFINPGSFTVIGNNAKLALQKQSTVLDTYLSYLKYDI